MNKTAHHSIKKTLDQPGTGSTIHAVGLYFGSFNPIHIAHLAIANFMVAYAGLDQVWFVVSPQNPHKKREALLHDRHRLDMAKVAAGNDPRLVVSDIEFSLPEPNYTIHTLKCLKEQYPELHFRMLLGSDNLKNFHKWKNYNEILRLMEIMVYPRPGFDRSQIDLPGNIRIVNDAPMMEISSSFIRNAVAAGKDVRHFLPPGVWDYIRENQFYR
jgi:nicotinate-nucleotide adenylyltransferase